MNDGDPARRRPGAIFFRWPDRGGRGRRREEGKGGSLRRGLGVALVGAVIMGAGGTAVALDWLKPCTDWLGRVPSTVPDPTTGYVFVPMGKCETVLAIDTETNRVVAVKKAGDGAHGVAVMDCVGVFVC